MPSSADVEQIPPTAAHPALRKPQSMQKAPGPNLPMEDPHLSAKTPVKSMGQLFNSQQYITPKNRMHVHLNGLMQSSPCMSTPGSGSTASSHWAMPNLHAPSWEVTPGIKATQNTNTPSSKMYSSGKKGAPRTVTPNSLARNPFDDNVVEKLHGSVFSPNVFTQCKSSENTPSSFKWTIDEMATMKPADIEEMPFQSDQLGSHQDHDLERRAQDVINAYFSQNLIAPSPWTNSTKKKPFQLPMTPRTPAPGCVESPMVFTFRSDTPNADKCRVSAAKTDAICQTTLTLPPDLDLEKMLGEYYTHKDGHESEESAFQDSLSVSSLRRKLFFHGDVEVVPSPVRPNKSRVRKGMEFSASPEVSPVKFQTPKQASKKSPMQTPGSAQFSSSPISGPHQSLRVMTPGLRRCSSDPDIMDSPGFSPIGSQHPSHQGIHSFQSPHAQPLQATPSSGRKSVCDFSPGMSPIVQMEGSFVTTPQSGSWLKRRGQGMKKVPVPIELLEMKSPKQTGQNAEQTEFGIQHMDVESDSFIKEPDEGLSFLADNNRPLSGAQRRMDDETCFTDEESSDHDTPQQTYFVSQFSQDTGYNTNSLQLTSAQDTRFQSAIGSHLEPGVSHTNLTQQFGSLPFSSQDTGLDLDDSGMDKTEDMALKKTRPIVRHVSSKSAISKEKVHLSEGAMHDCEVIRRARKVLGKSISLDESQQHSSSDPRPKLLNAIGVPAFPLVAPRQGPGPSGDEPQISGELAEQLLQRAGQDYMKYCNSSHSSMDNLHGMDMHDVTEPSVIEDYYLVPADQESPPHFRVSMSAEF